MGYVKNEDGDVKVHDAKGNVKWLPEHLAENGFLMKQMELTPVQAPVFLPPATIDPELNPEQLTPVQAPVEETTSDFEIETVAEQTKKTVKPKK